VAQAVEHPSDAAGSIAVVPELVDASTPDDAGTMSELLRVAGPLVVSAGSQSLMMVVNRWFLTYWDGDALAASLPALTLYWTVASIPYGIVIYVNTFVAQYEGVHRKHRVAASIWQGVWMSLIFGGLIAAIVPLCSLGIRRMGHEPEVVALEQAYFSLLCYGATFMLLSQAFTAYFSGRGQTRVVMAVSVIASLSNILWDALLIFGAGPFPTMGIRGAATATILSNALACCIYAVLIVRGAPPSGYPIWQTWRLDGELLKRMVRYGVPQGMQQFIDVAAFALYVFMIGWLGKVELAATNLAFNMNALAFVPMTGLATSVLILVGKRIGERRPDLAAQTTQLAFRLSAIYMLAFAAIYVLLPRLILAPFSTMEMDEGVQFSQVESLTIVLLRFVAIYTFFDAMAIIFGAAIRGAGDTQFSMWFLLLTSWPIMVLPTWLMAQDTQHRFSVAACWVPVTLYIVVLGFGFWLRYRAGHWRSMRVIDDELPPDLLISQPGPLESREPAAGSR
jgi:MATE family multidrug resistance protein